MALHASKNRLEISEIFSCKNSSEPRMTGGPSAQMTSSARLFDGIVLWGGYARNLTIRAGGHPWPDWSHVVGASSSE